MISRSLVCASLALSFCATPAFAGKIIGNGYKPVHHHAKTLAAKSPQKQEQRLASKIIGNGAKRDPSRCKEVAVKQANCDPSALAAVMKPPMDSRNGIKP
jgi:hypothetical protein